MRTLAWGVLACAVALVAWALLEEPHTHGTRADGDMRLARVYINTANVQRASDFYGKVFGAMPVPAAEPHARLLGASGGDVSVRPPGYGERGPVLTLLPRPATSAPPLAPQDLGYAHLCFEADDVGAMAAAIQASGGRIISRFAQPQREPVIYAHDPDGNVVEVHVPLPDPLTPGSVLRTLRSLARSWLGIGDGPNRIRLLHVNINATDWQQTLAQYEAAGLGRASGVQRSYDGDFIGNLTDVAGARVHGQHLALKGYHRGGPTLEIFTYVAQAGSRRQTLSDQGIVAVGIAAKDPARLRGRLAAAGFSIASEAGDATLMRDQGGNHLLIARD